MLLGNRNCFFINSHHYKEAKKRKHIFFDVFLLFSEFWETGVSIDCWETEFHTEPQGEETL